MSTFGKIDEFVPETEDWCLYIERLEHYLCANDIRDEDKRKSILLSVCGSKTYKLMSNLLSPVKPGDKTFSELKQLIQEHHHPKPSEIVQRYKFHSRFRQQGESVARFVAELRHLSEDCNFGATLESMLRDRLVCGVNDDRIQRRLLAESSLTFKKALDTATAMELAAKSAADLQKPGEKVHTVQLSASESQNFSGGKGQNKGYSKPFFNSGKCYRCGGKHLHSDCKFRDAECFNCHKKGHISKACKAPKAAVSEDPPRQNTNQVRPKQVSGKKPQKHVGARSNSSAAHYVDEDDEDVYSMYTINSTREDPYIVNLDVEGHLLEMEIDTGASTTVISSDTFQQLKNAVQTLELRDSSSTLKTYTGERLPVMGTCVVTVRYKSQVKLLRAVVVDGSGPSLLGRDWLKELKLNWPEIFHTNKVSDELDDLLRRYSDVFKEGLGTVKGTKAKIYVDASARPRYFKPRPVPYALTDKIEEELKRLQREGTIEPVQFSDWAAPIVPIVKEDKTIRICGDYKVTVNAVSKLDNYPIPKIDDLYATLSGGKEFTKLDLSQAYQQLELDEESKQYVTINTHKELYRYNRLPYGVSSAPGIFQRTMENILLGIPRVVVRVDDILVTGKTRSEHIEHLQEVLSRLSAAGVRLKRRKCTFMAKEVIYLGYRVNAEGIHPIQEKLEAIEEMPHPHDVKELQSFLGMVNYYNRFLPNLSTVLVPLHKLLRKETKWKWGPEEQASWLSSKKLLSSSQLLVHFDSAKDLLLACDASPYGVGAVLSHRMEDGSDRPICYASRTLSSAEKGYSQLEKEGLAIVFGVKKFHQYLYGNKFQLYTDHKPLVGLLREDRQVPLMAAARIQRWALTLAAYEYTLVYKEGRRHCNADGLSRLPLTTKHRQPPIPGEVILAVEQLDETPVKAEQVKKWTSQDPNLSKVTMYVQSGWPNKCPDASLQPYFANRTELSIHDGCLLRGNRVIVPLKGQAQLLENLHEGHPGINRMKSLARCYVWWPHLDSDLEDYVKECALCQQNRKPPAEAPLHSWDWPNRPWSRLHIDYAGPFMGKMFLVIIDSHSKWLEVCVMNTSTSAATIQKLREVFATHGLPEMIVSDNGACFTSDEFENFMKQNNIRHTKTAPYHPASNGLAERAVQTLKDGLRKQAEGTIKQKLARFLLTYRITPQTTTGAAPCELLMGRRIRSKLDSVRPDMQARVTQKQTQQKHYHDLHSKERTFRAGDPVYVKNFVHNPKWLPGIIEEQTGPVSFRIKLDGGRIVRRHVDHVRIRYDKEPSTNHESQSELSTSQVEELPSETTDSIVPIPTTEPNTKNELCEQSFDAASSRPVRSHHVPVRFRDFVM